MKIVIAILAVLMLGWSVYASTKAWMANHEQLELLKEQSDLRFKLELELIYALSRYMKSTCECHNALSGVANWLGTTGFSIGPVGCEDGMP